jgi:hypothetical protein
MRDIMTVMANEKELRGWVVQKGNDPEISSG